MSKVLIDRELAERVCHVDNSTRQTARRELRTILAAPSGTPAIPVKAYYHEAPNEYGGLNKSVGLEVRKTFADAPLVLESDALVQIACLEGEIAKRDARILELESDLAGTQSRVLSLQDQWRKLDGELAAIKAQEPVRYWFIGDAGQEKGSRRCKKSSQDGSLAFFESEFDAKRAARRHAGTEVYTADYYAAPVSEAKAQGVVIPPSPYMPGSQPTDFTDYELGEIHGRIAMWEEVKRLNAAPVQQVSVPDGWKLAPVEPTHEMLGAALMNQVECLDAIEVIRTDYKAMLAAAPAPGGE